MQRFEVLDSIPAEYKHKFINDGANGDCYRMLNGDVYKEFKMHFPFERELDILSTLKSPFFAFPKKLVYVGDYRTDCLTGYTMDYVDGVTFKELDRKTRIDDLLQASRDIENEILQITKHHGILLYDLNNGNVFIRPDVSFGVIDTDYYEYAPSNEAYDNAKYNMKMWNEYLLYNLMCYTNAFYSERLNLRFEIAMYTGKIKSSDMIEELLEEIRLDTGIDSKTLEDFFEGMKLIRRRKDI